MQPITTPGRFLPRPLLLCLILLLSAPLIRAQTLASRRMGSPPAQEVRLTLKEVLAELQQQYQIYFTYTDDILQHQVVSSTLWRQQTSLDAALKVLMKELHLKYKKVDNQHYVIKPTPSTDLEKGEPPAPGSSTASGLPDSQAANGMTGFPVTAPAAVFNVSGRVTNDHGEALPGVSVLLKGTTNGTATDPDGKYALSLPDKESNGTLVFSFIGYLSEEVAIGNRTVIDVQLLPDIQSLGELVVVGYGTARKVDLTGAITQVSAKDFNAGINPNPLQAIQGKVAGLAITQPSGDPNQAPTVRLRGYTSLAGGSDPLYVVDGVIGVPINSISPSDIETMDVLKDASAAAIYGSRAANGVILITTKRGKAGKTSFSINNYVGMENISRSLDLLNGDEYRAEVTRIKGAGALADLNRFPLGPDGKGYSTDWMKEISRTGYTNNHELALAGGSDHVTYRGSLNYINREGIIKNTGFERVTGRINLEQKGFNNRLNVQYSLALTNTNGKLSEPAVLNQASLFLPTLPVRNPDGSDANGGYYEVVGSQELKNPVAMQEGTRNDQAYKMLIGAVNLKYEVLDGLMLGVNGAYRYENSVTSQVQNAAILAWSAGQGLASRRLDQTNNKLLELTAVYTRSLGTSGSNFSLLGGYSYQDNVNDGFRAYNNNFLNGFYDLFGYDNLGAGSGTLIQPASTYTSSYKNRTTLLSFFGRATVNLSDKYNITATVRRDGSSKFGANHKWGVFPSFAAGWIVSNEGFLKGGHALSYLKLRVGWGQIGNSEGISPYQSRLLYGQVAQNYYDGGVNNFLPGYNVIQNANPNLKWEVVQTANVGLDFQLWGGRVNGAVDVYDKKTKDMLYNYNVPADGTKYFVPNILANVGEMSNKGIELSLGGEVIGKKDFSWNVSVVGQVQQTRIVSLKNDEFSVGTILYNGLTGPGLSDTYASKLQAGHLYGEFEVPQFVGFNPVGNMLFQAQEGDSATTDASRARMVIPGTALPQTMASLINTFRYKHFDLSFMLRGTFGNQIYNNQRSNQTMPGNILTTNVLREVADYPTNYSTNQLSSLWIESGTYVRLDNWQIGYNFPLKKSPIQNARLYFGGNNLFIITRYKGIDPELQVRGDLQSSTSQIPNTVGLDKGIYPKTRSFQLGLNLTF